MTSQIPAECIAALHRGETVTIQASRIETRRNRGNMPSVADGEAYLILTPGYEPHASVISNVQVETVVPGARTADDSGPYPVVASTVPFYAFNRDGHTIFDEGDTRPRYRTDGQHFVKPRDAHIPLLDADIEIARIEIGRGELFQEAQNCASTVRVLEACARPRETPTPPSVAR